VKHLSLRQSAVDVTASCQNYHPRLPTSHLITTQFQSLHCVMLWDDKMTQNAHSLFNKLEHVWTWCRRWTASSAEPSIVACGLGEPWP